MHVATTTVERLIDYCKNTPEDKFRTAESVKTINMLIDKNKGL
jgi:4-O-beta-D-mannosyl-D-glucose phosphorylase